MDLSQSGFFFATQIHIHNARIGVSISLVSIYLFLNAASEWVSGSERENLNETYVNDRELAE